MNESCGTHQNYISVPIQRDALVPTLIRVMSCMPSRDHLTEAQEIVMPNADP